MVNYENIVTELKKNYSLRLFAVVQMDELIDTSTVIFAAENVDDKNRDDIYKKINSLIDKNDDKASIVEVSRINIFDSNHYLAKGLLQYVDKGELIEVKINGNTIHRGTMYYPKPRSS
jgi:arginyl-tRNA synthetase